MNLLALRYCATLSATFFTFSIGQFESINAVLASCVCTIILVSITRLFFANRVLESDIYLGTFIGMTKVILPIEFLFLSLFALLTSIILKIKFNGFGGKLGSIAYLSGGVLILFKKVFI